MVAITDGLDTSNLSDVDDAVAARGNKQVITVAVGSELPAQILSDLEKLGNGGFYPVPEPNQAADEQEGEKPEDENLCEWMLVVQNRMIAYADGFYWLQYISEASSADQNLNHSVVLSLSENGNDGNNAAINGSFSSKAFFSSSAGIYFNATGADPDGIAEQVILIEKGQAAGSVTSSVTALTYSRASNNPSQYTWSSGNQKVVTVAANAKDSSKAIIKVVAPGDTIINVTDTANNVQQTLTISVRIKEDSFEMIKHVVTSKGPWFVDATFQVRETYDEADYDDENPWVNQWIWVTDLAREDLTVMENGTAIDMENSETHLRKRDDIPSNYTYTLKTVLLIDNSPSNRTNLELIKEAAKAFAERVLINDPEDDSDGPLLDIEIVDPETELDEHYQQEIAIVSFEENGEEMLVQDFTTDLDVIDNAIDGIVKGFGPVSFYGAMLDALNLWDNNQHPYAVNNTDLVQGVVVVLSDGWESNEGFYAREAVLGETGDKQIICVGVGDDLVSTGNDVDLIAFGNAGFYSVPDPGGIIVNSYTRLEKTLMDIQDKIVEYANSFYWLDYKSYVTETIDWIDDCDRREDITISINNNSKTGSGSAIWSKFKSCDFFDGIDGTIYVNSSVTNPDGITGDIDLKYVLLGNIPIADPTYALEAFTYDNPYDDSYVKNPPAYEWTITSPFVKVTPVPGSYANSRATLSLPAAKSTGTASLRIDDNGNTVWRNIDVNVSKLQLPGPIAYYPFNGNADDAIGNGYDGEVFGATLISDRFGNSNSAYSFNGTSDYIAIKDLHYGTDSSALAASVNDITVCAWFKTSYADQWGRRIVGFGAEDYWSLLNENGNIDWLTSVPDQPYANTLKTESTYSDNQWHFACATYSYDAEKQTSLYIDGVLTVTKDLPLGPIGTGVTQYGFIGTSGSAAVSYNAPRYNNVSFFNGQIDDVIIFDQSLSDEQVNLLWQTFK